MTRPLTVRGVAEPSVPPITVRVDEFCRISGISERKVYKMLKSGELKSIKLAGMRLIDVEHYRRMVSELGTQPYHGNQHGKILLKASSGQEICR